MAAGNAIQKLLLSHMGMGQHFNYRNLYSMIELESLEPKRSLLADACGTCCAEVVNDVLLFLSQTMAPNLFYEELRLSSNVFALNQWASYLRQKQKMNQGSAFVSLQDFPLIALYRGVGNYNEMANEIVQLILTQSNKNIAMEWATEAQIIFENTNQPIWIRNQLRHHVQLDKLLSETEARDRNIAPEAESKAGYVDQRSFTQGLNWMKRYFILKDGALTIRKHEPEKVARFANPFLDKREDVVRITIDMKIVRKHHQSSTHAKQLDRPYCLELIHNDQTIVIMDARSQEEQDAWNTAFESNIKRSGLESVWIDFPRSSVLGISLSQFIRYCMLYPDAASEFVHDTHILNNSRLCTLRDTFGLDSNRLLYLAVLHCGQTKKWELMGDLTRPGKVKRLFTAQPQSSIGFGAFLDTAIQFSAPFEVISHYQALFTKQTKGWSSLHANRAISRSS